MSSFYGNGGGIAQGGGDILAEKMYICGANEYDTSTGLPSIVDPEQGMFYLVPAGDEEENNLFNQFIYKDGEWEKFGSGGLKLDDLVVIAGTGTGSAMTKNGNTASGEYSFAEGNGTIASGYSSHAEGANTTASSNYSHAEGNYTIASGAQSHAEGTNTTASGNYSHAEGHYTIASGENSHAEGAYTIANHRSQHVFGEYNIEDPSNENNETNGNYIEIVGNGISVTNRSNARTLDWSGNQVLAGKLTVGAGPTNDMDVATKQYVDQHSSSGGSGLQNLIDGSISGSVRSINSKAEDSNYTMGSNAIAEGYNTKASGSNSHAEGSNTTASGGQSHAEGAGTVASSSFSHAEGERTTASGGQAHSEGAGTTASGDCSHAEGGWTIASGYYSHAEGVSTIANHRAQRVFGTYNIEDPSTENNETNGNYIEIVGNGTDNATRSNARTLDWLGNEVLAGKLTVGSDPVNNMDVTTKQYVDKIFTDAVKQALLNCFAHVAWTDGNGQAYYDALNQALYPISSISATFNQGSATIMEDDPLSNLKQYLTVNATYLDEHTEEVTDYTLSGELINSTSEITVTYQGKTTTFNVTVTPVPVLNVNVGKGISYDTTQVVTNAKRCISDKVPFVNTAPIKVQWKENTDYRWALKNETAAGAMDSTGARWSPDMDSTQAQQDSSLDGWIFSGEEQTKQTSEPYASTSGYCRILFAPLAGMTADLPATRPSGYMTITGTKYRLQAVES